ncbi:MAG: tetratricopeptide repeat protein [Magnetococcales bacterium]|nr:tetratricopeptide repeat protein [Magnetococcales bacterium]
MSVEKRGLPAWTRNGWRIVPAQGLLWLGLMLISPPGTAAEVVPVVPEALATALRVAVEAEAKRDAGAVDHFLKAARLAAEAKRPQELMASNDAILRLREAIPERFLEKQAAASGFPAEKGETARKWSVLNQESATLLAKGDLVGAVDRAGKSLEMAKTEFGARHFTVLVALRELAILRYQSGAPAEAESGLEQAIALGTESLGADHPETLKLQTLLADLLEAGGGFVKARELRKGVLAGWEKALGADHPAALEAGLVLARLHLNMGDADSAHQWLVGARERFEKSLGNWHPRLAECLALTATALARKGEVKGALAEYEKAFEIQRMALPSNALAALTPRVEAAELIRREGRFDEARKILEEVIGLARSEPTAAQALLDAQGALAQVFEDAAEYDQAEPLIREVLRGEQAMLGPDHPNLLATRNRLAGIYRRQGRLAEAEKLYAEVLDGYRKVLGTEHQASINLMNNLGLVYENEGLYDEAEPLLRAALQSSRKVAGEDHPETLAMMNNLALLHESQGNFDKAEPLYRNAIAIATRKLGEKHPDALAFVNNLAYLHLLQQNYAEAAPLFEQVLTHWSAVHGESHQKSLKALNNLARARHKLGAREEAEKRFKKALTLRQSVLGERHMDTLRTMRDLGALYLDMGRLPEAEELLRKALQLDEEVLGKQHPYTFETLHTLADTLEAKKSPAALQESFALRREGFARRSEFLNRMLWATGDNAREGYVRLHRGELNTFLSQISRQESAAGGRELLEVGLRRKGLLLKITAEMRQVMQMSKNPQLEVIGRRLTSARKKLAALTLSGPTPETKDNHLKLMNELEETVDKLQLDLGRMSKRFRRSVDPVTLEKLLEHLPEDAVLVDFLTYSERGRNRLVAGTLRREQGKPVFAMVPYRTDMDELQKVIVDYRTIIQEEGIEAEELTKAGQEAYDVIWAPLKAALGERKVVYVVPDGLLNILPFNALIDEEGIYLAKSLDLHLLTSSRDLLPTEIPAAQGGLMILAGPDYDSDKVVDRQVIQELEGKRSASGAAELKEGLRAFSQGMRGLHFDPLPGAEKEGKLILGQAGDQKQENRLFLKFDAQEKVVQSIETPPEVLHIATHGFFLKADDSLRKRLLKMQRGGEVNMPPPGDNPLLRSGLAFAGINGNAGFLGEIDTRNDGVLTALEVLSLDLTGTRLTVLSACETGLGEIHEGEGVYGLRRSFQEAGSEAVIASLWEVSDAGTQALMTGLYKRLLAGKTPHESLREARLEMMDSEEWSYPYIWSAFMLVGK